MSLHQQSRVMLSALASSPVGFKSFLLSLWNTYQRQRCQTLTKLSVCSCVLMCMCRLLFYNYRLTPHSCVCHLIETSPFPVITSSASSSSPALLSPHRLLWTKRTSLLVHTRRCVCVCVYALSSSLTTPSNSYWGVKLHFPFSHFQHISHHLRLSWELAL